MKAKTLMGMIACAGACVSISAFGNTTNDWFSVGVTGDAIAPVNCSTNGVAVSIENSKIVLDNEYTTRLAITPAVVLANTNSTDIAKIDVTALLTPSSTNDLAVINDAKAGFAVGIDDQNQTNYYGFANGVWNKLTGGNPAKDSDTTFSIIINYRDSVVDFVADGVDLTPTPLAIAANSSFTGIDAFGSGSITSVNSKFEVAVAAYDGKKYGSVSDAITAGGATGTIQYINNSGTPVSVTAANGLDAATCIALGVDPTSATAKVRFVPADSDTDANNVTLKVNSDSIDTGLYVTYTVSGGSAPTPQQSNDGTVKIPTTTGVYTITPTSVSTSPAN